MTNSPYRGMVLAGAIACLLAMTPNVQAQGSGEQPPLPDAKESTEPGSTPEKQEKDLAETLAKKLPDVAAERTRVLTNLYAHLAASGTESEAKRIMAVIERIWTKSGSDTVDLLMSRAAKAANQKKSDLALRLLDQAAELAPDNADVFGRRAQIHYQKDDMEKALGDLRRAVALDPNHYRAIEGIARVFKDLGREKSALAAFRRLLEINPHAAGTAQGLKELEREVEGQEL